MHQHGAVAAGGSAVCSLRVCQLLLQQLAAMKMHHTSLFLSASPSRPPLPSLTSTPRCSGYFAVSYSTPPLLRRRSVTSLNSLAWCDYLMEHNKYRAQQQHTQERRRLRKPQLVGCAESSSWAAQAVEEANLAPG